MGYWNSRGLRGSALETLINYTNDFYRQKNLAIIQKIPTPITPVEVDNEKHIIQKAYFDAQSTVDYIGMAQGLGLCFDAKETAQTHLPLQNIHAHQVDFMERFLLQGGISFLLVHFSLLGKYYFLPFDVLKTHWEAAKNGGRKSIPMAAFEEKFEIMQERNGILNYLKAINICLLEQKKGQNP